MTTRPVRKSKSRNTRAQHRKTKGRAMPTKFVDNAGNEFVLTFSYGLFRAIRNEIGIDAANPNDIPKLLNSPVDLIQFAFCVCRNKCKQLGISESEFESNFSEIFSQNLKFEIPLLKFQMGVSCSFKDFLCACVCVSVYSGILGYDTG